MRAQAAVTEGQLGFALLFVGAGALPAMLLAGRALDRWGTPVVPGWARGTATSIVTTVAYLGFLTGPVYVGWWASSVSLSGAMFAVAGLAGALLVITAFAAGPLGRLASPWLRPEAGAGGGS